MESEMQGDGGMREGPLGVGVAVGTVHGEGRETGGMRGVEERARLVCSPCVLCLADRGRSRGRAGEGYLEIQDSCSVYRDTLCLYLSPYPEEAAGAGASSSPSSSPPLSPSSTYPPPSSSTDPSPSSQSPISPSAPASAPVPPPSAAPSPPSPPSVSPSSPPASPDQTPHPQHNHSACPALAPSCSAPPSWPARCRACRRASEFWRWNRARGSQGASCAIRSLALRSFPYPFCIGKKTHIHTSNLVRRTRLSLRKASI